MSNIPLTEELISKLKADNPGVPLFKKQLYGQDYVFTYLTREDTRRLREWTERNPNVKVTDYDDHVVQIALKFPEIDPVNEATLAGGVYETLSGLIQKKSLLLPGEVSVEAEAVTTDDRETQLSSEEIAKVTKGLGHPASLVRVAGRQFVIRPITRLEWKQLQAAQVDDIEVALCKRCTLLPANFDWDKELGGLASVVSAQIMRISAFQDEGTCEEL